MVQLLAQRAPTNEHERTTTTINNASQKTTESSFGNVRHFRGCWRSCTVSTRNKNTVSTRNTINTSQTRRTNTNDPFLLDLPTRDTSFLTIRGHFLTTSFRICTGSFCWYSWNVVWGVRVRDFLSLPARDRSRRYSGSGVNVIKFNLGVCQTPFRTMSCPTKGRQKPARNGSTLFTWAHEATTNDTEPLKMRTQKPKR